MKNLFTALALVAAVSFVACGPSQEEIDKANKRKQDSIDSVNAAMAAEEAARMEAEQKMKDLNCDTIEAAMKMVEGSARSMGIEVVGG